MGCRVWVLAKAERVEILAGVVVLTHSSYNVYIYIYVAWTFMYSMTRQSCVHRSIRHPENMAMLLGKHAGPYSDALSIQQTWLKFIMF